MAGRDELGRFQTGHGGFKKKGTKHTITQNMLNQFVKFEEQGGKSPFILWRDIISGVHDEEIDMMGPKDAWGLRIKASELMAKYCYDASFDTDEASEQTGLSVAQVEALKAAFPQFNKGNV